MKQDSQSTSVPDPQLAGIGGWLLVPTIGLLYLTVNRFLDIVGPYREHFSTWYADWTDLGYFGVYPFVVLGDLGLLALAIYVAVQLFGKKKKTPLAFVTLLFAMVAVSGILFAISAATQDWWTMDYHRREFFLTLIHACIWIPYFRKSRRVMATFVV